jgi:hypothetical protein
MRPAGGAVRRGPRAGTSGVENLGGWLTTVVAGPGSVMAFTVVGGRIVQIDVLADPARVSQRDPPQP